MVRVFVIDDGPESVEPLETVLRAAGYRVLATSGLKVVARDGSRVAPVDLASEGSSDGPASDSSSVEREAHAAARWARALIPILEAPKDPRTLNGWSSLTHVSSGALRTWCVTVGISPRRSMVFARLLRAVLLGHGGRHKPENLLDVVDRRTIIGLRKLAGLEVEPFPRTVEEFLCRQRLVRDADVLSEVTRALASRRK